MRCKTGTAWTKVGRHVAAVCFLMLTVSGRLAAETIKKTDTGKNYTLTAYYNETVQPGDAVFVRLELAPRKNKKKALAAESHAKIALTAGTKVIRSEACYHLSRTTLLAGIPLSSYIEAGLYALVVTCAPFGGDEETLSLPVTIKPKEFVSETIPLDSANTSIKTNYGKERIAQIERLNKILGTRNAGAIYATKAFTPPTPATRRTSFFADRRVFTYTGGGSSTSLHYGIDYGVPTGSEVRACAPGKVVMAEDRISTGWSVCIEHLPGLYSLYYHMSRLDVAAGDIVPQGALLGLSGATGLATGPHLHWEVRLNMEAVNPDFFTGDFTFEQAAR